jgi:putative heme-binding domain-containing protein
VAGAGITFAQTRMTPEQILDLHVKDEKGGSAQAGRPIYEERCAACHRFGALGKDVGPDLTTLSSRFKKKDVLESILWPSKIISDQYQAEMFELNDGKIVAGFIVRETAKAVLVRTAENPDKPVVVTLANVANRVPSSVSLMPEGLFEGLSAKQIADLLAFVLAPPPDK